LPDAGSLLSRSRNGTMKTLLSAPRNGSVMLVISGPNGVKILLQWRQTGICFVVEAPDAVPAVTRQNLRDLMVPEAHETTLETVARVRALIESSRTIAELERRIVEL
jgi:hypothetical protein